MPLLTRRQSIAALGGGGVAVGVLGAGVLAGDENTLVHSILARVVGGFDMTDAEFRTFVADLDSGRKWKNTAWFALFRIAGATDPDAGPARLRDRLEDYEREVVTKFLTRTDYLRIDPRSERVSFVGDAACSSPFANFDLA